jgi:hypothetical protein
MEKQLSAIGYWLGLICTALALIIRLVAVFRSLPPFVGASGGAALTYNTFLHGAALFFLLTIASWCRIPNSPWRKDVLLSDEVCI